MIRVVFVCTGNICRSPMAEGMLRTRLYQRGIRDIRVSSMGIRGLTGSRASEKAVMICAEHGVDISGHVSREMQPGELDESSLILGMEQVHVEYIKTFFPMATDRTFLYGAWPNPGRGNRGIADPIGRSGKYYRAIFDDIDKSMPEVTESVISLRQEGESRSA